MASGAALPMPANNTNPEMVMAPQSRLHMLLSNEILEKVEQHFVCVAVQFWSVAKIRSR
jgi:hypothetical protein